jgi:DNA mismatch endonuclease (patch repair protein)
MFYQTRRQIMQSIRGRGNKTTELAFANMLRMHQITGWRRHLPLPGKPDFVFPKQKLAVFVDGCFWHGCPKHSLHVTRSGPFWFDKIHGNKRRDRRKAQSLRKRGWRVIRVWEHDLVQQRHHHIVSRLKRALNA